MVQVLTSYINLIKKKEKHGGKSFTSGKTQNVIHQWIGYSEPVTLNKLIVL